MQKTRQMRVAAEFEREVLLIQNKYRERYKDRNKVDITREIAWLLRNKKLVPK